MIRLMFSALFLFSFSPAPLAAEEACIRYHKCIPLDGFKCESVSRSSLVHRVCYLEAKRYMLIWLGRNEIAYHYCEIGSDVVAALLAAPSMGRFYNQNIKSDATGRKFDCRDHPIPEL